MITTYAGKDDTAKFVFTDSAGVPVDLTTHEATVIVEAIGEYAVVGDETGVGYAVVPGADTEGYAGFFHYWALVDGEVSEEGVWNIRPQPSS